MPVCTSLELRECSDLQGLEVLAPGLRELDLRGCGALQHLLILDGSGSSSSGDSGSVSSQRATAVAAQAGDVDAQGGLWGGYDGWGTCGPPSAEDAWGADGAEAGAEAAQPSAAAPSGVTRGHATNSRTVSSAAAHAAGGSGWPASAATTSAQPVPLTVHLEGTHLDRASSRRLRMHPRVLASGGGVIHGCTGTSGVPGGAMQRTLETMLELGLDEGDLQDLLNPEQQGSDGGDGDAYGSDEDEMSGGFVGDGASSTGGIDSGGEEGVEGRQVVGDHGAAMRLLVHTLAAMGVRLGGVPEDSDEEESEGEEAAGVRDEEQGWEGEGRSGSPQPQSQQAQCLIQELSDDSDGRFTDDEDADDDDDW